MIKFSKSRDGALAERPVLQCPFRSHSRSTGIGAPDPGKQVVIVAGCQAVGISYGCRLPAVESVAHLSSSPLYLPIPPMLFTVYPMLLSILAARLLRVPRRQ